MRAYSTLYNSGTPTMGNAAPPRTITLATGDASYYGTLTGDTWKLIGVGTVRNPTGPGTEPVVRTVSGKAALGSAHRGTANNAVWNYVYLDDPTATTTLGNSVDVDIPLYVRGNLVLTNTAQVSSYALQVGGTLEFRNTAHVGTAAEPIQEAHVAGGCRVGSSGAFVKPCGPDQMVHATISDSTPVAFVNSTFCGPIIARRVSLANSTVNHYVPIGTLMPGMPASYEDVVTITNEPGSWG